MSGAQLPPLRDVIAGLGLSARKSFGQNFLLDMNITRKIARSAAPLDEATIYEVGPGPGGLTRALLEEGARRVIAVEKDQRFIEALQPLEEAYAERLRILPGDALTLDESGLFDADSKAKIVANLPYNVATPLLVKWLEAEPWPPWYDQMTLMFQREVAERLTAQPGGKSYGRLSVLAQWRTDPMILFNLPAEAFVPPPKVASTVVQFAVRDSARAPADIHALSRVAAAAFGQRRKMLRRSLSQLPIRNTDRLIEQAGVEPTARAEDLSVEEFCALARAYDAVSS